LPHAHNGPADDGAVEDGPTGGLLAALKEVSGAQKESRSSPTAKESQLTRGGGSRVFLRPFSGEPANHVVRRRGFPLSQVANMTLG
jgi:hypothetical protein